MSPNHEWGEFTDYVFSIMAGNPIWKPKEPTSHKEWASLDAHLKVFWFSGQRNFQEKLLWRLLE